MEPRIESKEAFLLVGIKYTGSNPADLPGLWQLVGGRVGEIKNLEQPGVAYGVATSYDPSTEVFEYIAGFGVSKVEDIPDGMISFEVPEQKYAVFTMTLPTFEKTYRNITENWLPQSGYQRIEGPEFELYDEKFDPQDSSSELSFYIPIM